MKTLTTIIFIIFIGTVAQAQENVAEVTVDAVEMTIVKEDAREINLETKTEVARLYKHKNARVAKALSFTTKRNKAKTA